MGIKVLVCTYDTTSTSIWDWCTD